MDDGISQTGQRFASGVICVGFALTLTDNNFDLNWKHEMKASLPLGAVHRARLIYSQRVRLALVGTRQEQD